MAAGDSITTNGQWELNGLLMGQGTSYLVEDFQMWVAPDIRPGETVRAQSHGAFPGTDWLGTRLVSAIVNITPSTQTAEIAAMQTLAGAWQPPADGATVPLVWQVGDGVKYRLNGKPRLASTAFEYWMPTECRFVATDPRIYANTESSASTGLATGSGGLSFAATAPFVFGTSGGAFMSCTNSGTFNAPWTATFTGPLVAPTLTHVGTGKALILSGASIAAGETLVVSSASRTVLLNGTASRYSWLAATSQWFDLSPGANSVNLTGASGAGSVTIAWRSAWI
jgi:hypothetical protein